MIRYGALMRGPGQGVLMRGLGALMRGPGALMRGPGVLMRGPGALIRGLWGLFEKKWAHLRSQRWSCLYGVWHLDLDLNMVNGF